MRLADWHILSRVKILYAVHAAIVCFIPCKMATRPSEAIRFAIADEWKNLSRDSRFSSASKF